MSLAVFLILGLASVIFSLLMVFTKNPVHSVIFLILTFFSIAGQFVLLNAQFLAVVHIIVYAGAIMVLFLFVIMLLAPFGRSTERDKRKDLILVAVLLGSTALLLLYPLIRAYDPSRTPQNVMAPPDGVSSIPHLAETLFYDYLLPFAALAPNVRKGPMMTFDAASAWVRKVRDAVTRTTQGLRPLLGAADIRRERSDRPP